MADGSIFAENILNCELKEENWQYGNMNICNGFVSLYGNIFKYMDNHSYERNCIMFLINPLHKPC